MDYLFHILVFICIYGILAGSLNLVVGLTGMLSIAHAALWGVGAYTSALLSLHMELPFVLSVLSGTALTALVSLVVILLCRGLSGDYFAMATFGFQMILFAVISNWLELTRGPMGLTGIPHARVFDHDLSTPRSYVLLVLIVYVLSLFIFRLIIRSGFGRTLRAIREDEVFTQSLGKNVGAYKTAVFVIAGAFGGFAGALYAHYVTYIDPSSFTVLESVFVISMLIIGGAGTIWGPVLGAALLVVVPEMLRLAGLPSSIAANVQQIIYAGLLVAFIVARPQGLLGRRGA